VKQPGEKEKNQRKSNVDSTVSSVTKLFTEKKKEKEEKKNIAFFG